MALIALTSASGSPGVTTTALAMATTWPRPVLVVDADPVGGSAVQAGYLQARIPHGRGLTDLAMASRHGRLLEEIHAIGINLPDSPARLIPGARNPAQARACQSVWAELAPLLAAMDRSGTDVIVDLGRLGMTGFATPLMDRADVIAICTQPYRVPLKAVHGWVQDLRERAEQTGGSDRLGVITVGTGESAARIAKALKMPILATVAADPATAHVFYDGAARKAKFPTSPLMRSISTVNDAVHIRIREREARLRAHQQLIAPAGDIPDRGVATP